MTLSGGGPRSYPSHSIFGLDNLPAARFGRDGINFSRKPGVVRVCRHIEGSWLVTVKLYQPRERESMLTEFALRNLKPRTALYKIADRDGMYVAVSPVGTLSFRYDYRVNGRWETLTIGRYGQSASLSNCGPN